MSQTIVVFGVTGLIGSSVAQALAQNFKVKGITRDPNSPKCQKLKSQGIDIIQADTSNPKQLEEALKGAYGCFGMTNTDLSDKNCLENEKQQGLAIATACQKTNVQHIVYSTQMSVVRTIGLNARHMDAKADIEREFKQLGLPVTSIIIPLLYENIMEQPLRPTRVDADCYGLDIPIGHGSLYMISSEDIGPIILNMFLNRQRWLNKTFSVCGDKRTVPEIAAIMSTYCQQTGIFRDLQFTLDQWEQHHPYSGSQDFKAMFSFYARVDQRASVDSTAQIYPQLLSFEDWVAGHTDVIIRALNFPDEPAKDPWACI